MKLPRCEICKKQFVLCDQYGRPTENGDFMVCPGVWEDFLRDDQGFYYRKKHDGTRPLHPEVRPRVRPGLTTEKRKATEAASPFLFDEETMKKRTLRKKVSVKDLRRGTE